MQKIVLKQITYIMVNLIVGPTLIRGEFEDNP